MQNHNLPNVDALCRQDTRRASITGTRVLMALTAVGALAAAAASIQAERSAGPETLVIEVWRLAGFVLFSGLFALLAYRPLHYAGVWELAIISKLALTIVFLTYASDANGAEVVALVDGTLTGVIIAAYLLSRGWRAWSHVAPRRGGRVSARGENPMAWRRQQSAYRQAKLPHAATMRPVDYDGEVAPTLES